MNSQLPIPLKHILPKGIEKIIQLICYFPGIVPGFLFTKTNTRKVRKNH